MSAAVSLRLAQITDPHIGADWVPGDPIDSLSSVLDAILALPDRPDAMLVTGDLGNGGTERQYAALRERLDASAIAYHVLPGNHDDRATLRRAFELPGSGDDPIQFAIDLGDLRVLMLDTTIPGQDGGALGAGRLAWIAAELAAEPDAPTLVAMHHPPLLTGLAGMDGIALPRADRDALAELLTGHPQVRGLVAGHVHRTIAAGFAGRPLLTIPSTYAQAPLDLSDTTLDMVRAPTGFAVHMLVDGRLVSHVETLSV